MLVHLDCFLRPIGIDKLILYLLESIFVLKVQSVHEMHFWKLIISVIVGKSEGFVKALLVSLKVHCCFNWVILDQELSSLIAFHVFSHLYGEFS